MTIYYVIFSLCLFIELSPKINTDNAFKKLFIGMIAIGSLVWIARKPNDLIEFGLIGYFLTLAYCAYFRHEKL